MSAAFDLAEAGRFRLNARLGRSVEQQHLDQFGPVRVWRPFDEKGHLDIAQLIAPLAARKGWVWRCELDPWAILHPDMVDLLVAVATSSHATVGGRALFLFETADEAAFLRWKHAIMREAIQSVVGYLSSYEYARSSRARAELNIPMTDPAPPTPEVRRLYDGALYAAKWLRIEWPRQELGRRLPECHWQKWPIQHVLVAGVGGGWDR